MRNTEISGVTSRDSYGATEPSLVLNVEPKARGLEYSKSRVFIATLNQFPAFRRSITVAAHGPRFCAAIAVLMLAGCASLSAQPFVAGDTADFQISWNVFGAGTAHMTLAEVPGAPMPTWRATVEAQSTGIVTRLYKVEDVYHSTFLAGTYCSEQLEKTIHEGNRHRDLKVDFDAQRRLALIRETDTTRNRVMRQQESPIPACAFDVISGLYYVRSLKLEVGKPFQVPINDGSHTVLVDVEVQAKEEIKTPAGVFHTIRIEPQVFGGTLFKKSGRMQIWLTDDDKHRLVQLRARLIFGNITATAMK